MMSLGLYLANSKNDPDYSKAAALLDHLRQTSTSIAATFPLAVQETARKYSDHLTTVLAEIFDRSEAKAGNRTEPT
jgi:hypothetical protein